MPINSYSNRCVSFDKSTHTLAHPEQRKRTALKFLQHNLSGNRAKSLHLKSRRKIGFEMIKLSIKRKLTK